MIGSAMINQTNASFALPQQIVPQQNTTNDIYTFEQQMKSQLDSEITGALHNNNKKLDQTDYDDYILADQLQDRISELRSQIQEFENRKGKVNEID